VADYAGRIEKFLRFEVEMLKAQPYERIAERVLEKAKSAQLLVVLDERGKEYDTAGFADLISSWMNQGVKSVAFVVGGADGLPAAVLKRADLKVSLSKMTLPHRLARVVLLEQIYRGLCIIRKVPYQK
jgi:23S rRNA (pseudouridine1915-N3)-methyltransferase